MKSGATSPGNTGGGGIGDGGGGNAAVPGDNDATCRALGAADCADLAARMTDAQASIDRLVALQAWAREVSAIEVDRQ